MKSLPSLKKWIAGIIIVTLVIAAVYINHVLSEVDHMLGGNTEEVDFSRFKTTSGPIAITNINVLSEDSQSMLAGQTVLIKNNEIKAVGAGLTVPKGFTAINGSSKYLIPGLIDSHVHIKKSKNDLLLYLANGVTQIGEMTGMKHHFTIRSAIEQGALGPDIYIASPKVSSQKGMMPTLRSWFERRHQNYHTPDEGRAAVRKYQSKGYQAIKISSDLSKDIYFAINDEAKKRGIPVIGHLPIGHNLDDLFRSGQSQLAHIDSILYALQKDSGQINVGDPDAYLNYIKNNADTIAAQFKKHKITLASTLWLHDTLADQGTNLKNFLKTIELEYQNPGWLEGSMFSKGWLPGNNSYEYTDHEKESQNKYSIYRKTRFEALSILTRALLKKGVMITAGTDAHGAAGVIAGFSLHKELQTLSQAGLSNAEVLHAATVAPAQWMGVNTGKIAKGYQADFVVLNNNPLLDIDNTQSINAVMTNGQYLDRSQLDAMLAAVKNANNNSRKVNIDAYLEN